MSPSNAPSHGQKVDLGQDAPTKQEGAGFVAPDSLAAENYRSGGEFAANPNSQPDSYGRAGRNEQATAAVGSGSGSGSGFGLGSSGPQGDSAPSYVENQYIRDRSGPHGKNITEGGAAFDDPDSVDGLQRALRAEPGSKDDPSRLAEQQFEAKQSAVAGGAGQTQFETTNETKFDGLKETSA